MTRDLRDGKVNLTSTKDARDLRDPQKLGEILQVQVWNVRGTYGDDIPLSQVYDHHVRHFDIPDYSHTESMCDLTKREYRAELEARAAEGDKHAANALADLRAGKRVSNDDPAGA